MRTWRPGLLQALLVLAVWILLTLGPGLVRGDGHHASLAQAAGQGLGLTWLLAAVFAFAVAWRAGPEAMGLGRPRPLSSIHLVWLPLVYVSLMLAVDLLVGPPPAPTVLIVACNMLLVGLSEELMFRSILFRGMLTRFRIWPAVLLTSLLFGLVHTLNVLGTGRLDQSLMQSLTAFMQGFAYLAIRIRTCSVWPMVVVHALWDFSLMLTGLSHPGAGNDAGWSLLPVLVTLPIFLYGLFLLRNVQRDDGAWSAVAAPPTPTQKGST